MRTPRTGSDWTLIATIAGAAITIAAVAAIGGSTDSSNPGVVPPTSIDRATTQVAIVPDLVGMRLQRARGKANGSGFYLVGSHDSLKHGRTQATERDWTVCSQNIPAGTTVPVNTWIDLGTVQVKETCP